MKRSVSSVAMAALLAGTLVTQTSCIGNFKLTQSLLTWNQQLGNKWVNELVFLGMATLPVYFLAILGDAFLFNAFEFWGATNPISDTTEGADEVALRTFESGDRLLEVERVPADTGHELRLRGYENGRLIHEARLLATGDGRIHKLGPQGEVLLTAALRPSGSASIHDPSTGEITEFVPAGGAIR